MSTQGKLCFILFACLVHILYIIILYYSVVMVYRVAQSTSCPCDWKMFNGKCYYFSQDTRDWNGAKSHCSQQGSNLAVVKTSKELKFLGSQISSDHWLGLIYQQRTWTWLDGSSVERSFWDSGRPSSNPGCGKMTNKLSKSNCASAYRWICEKAALGSQLCV
uniref:C-type lectin domain-containing protein n=1 Tax=Lepisosteus oculatus TaxID=7918 RepID=W5MQ64_LEPOC